MREYDLDSVYGLAYEKDSVYEKESGLASRKAYVMETECGSVYDLETECEKVLDWVCDSASARGYERVSVKAYETLCEIPYARGLVCDLVYDSAYGFLCDLVRAYAMEYGKPYDSVYA